MWNGFGWLATEALGLTLGLLVGIWPGQPSLSDSLLFTGIVAPSVYGIVVFGGLCLGLLVMCMEGLRGMARLARRVIGSPK